MLLFAKYLQNPNSPPIENPAVWVEGDRIRYAGPRSELPREALTDPEMFELEGAALFPGLVNAHCHLELSFLNDLNNPGGFTPWIREVLKQKNQGSPQDQLLALDKGILLSILGGTTTIGDHVSFNMDLEPLLRSPLRGRLFIEVLGVVPEVAHEVLAAADKLTEIYQGKFSRWQLTPSPHSVHALVPTVLEEILARPHGVYSVHLGESEDEARYFEEASGPLFDLIAERGKSLKHNFVSALQELESKGFFDDRIMAIHGNYFSPAELALCGRRGVSLVHCPFSHQYFGHQDFPLIDALAAEVNVALGTDSLASASTLSMLEVMRQVKKTYGTLDQEQIFAMATLGGAKALKMPHLIGEVQEEKKADLIGVRMGSHLRPLDALFAADHAEFSMIDGVRLME